VPVILAAEAAAVEPGAWDAWACLPGADPAGLPVARRKAGLEADLEAAFDQAALEWWSLSRQWQRGDEPLAAHTPACAPNASDFGLILAWVRLVESWAQESPTMLVVCRDPWIFRQLAAFPGVLAKSAAPPLRVGEIKLALRGIAARARVAVRVALTAVRLRGQRAQLPPARPSLLVYGHPGSDAAGKDAYFGGLMTDLPDLTRVLHVDCGLARARVLHGPRTVSLHAWGNPLAALTLPLKRWRPERTDRDKDLGWLIRRAAARENGTGQAAMIAWQVHCQRRWLAQARPSSVAWPWENHSWERDFVRTARRLGIATVGYQHSVIGTRMLNYAAHALADPDAVLPDRIACTGAATRDQLRAWGAGADRLHIAGALRFPQIAAMRADPAGPVFMALPFDQDVAAEMVAAARQAARDGWTFIVKDHPMTPFAFAPSPGVAPTDLPLGRQAPVRAVVYAATTVGLEALLMGLPTVRFRPAGRIALDIMPSGCAVPVTGAMTLAGDLANLDTPPAIDRSRIFAEVDLAWWRGVLMRK
jgi:hypothetical protein